jgi:predicted RNA-binding protein associated with RNAse of E/G family
VPGGFELKDMVLDMVVSPDTSEWRWKDEDDFREMVELGVITQEKADALRAAGESALEMLRSGESPFERWRDWVPPEGWRGISLPAEWKGT